MALKKVKFKDVPLNGAFIFSGQYYIKISSTKGRHVSTGTDSKFNPNLDVFVSE